MALGRPTGTAGSSLWTTLRSITADPSGNARAAANLSPDDGSGESSCVAVPYAQLRDTPVEAGAVPYPLEIDVPEGALLVNAVFGVAEGDVVA